ncbi:hypothetical protein F5Y19DRAFT_477522 [Xylariaceae sp. FL1651]|nr:hypothetical protein F5Y19DRAFT_477522 [Xylariaceae sp. FL1651]
MRSIVAAVLFLAAGTRAHFTVQYPDTVGPFDDDNEGKEPCGGYSPDLSTIQTHDFHVGGDAIATYSSHPQTTWLYRITTDATASGNWTQVYGIVQQSGPGNYCTPAVTIPPEYVGKKAILSIVGDGPDGVLYQCSALNFVSGTANVPSACVNGSSITASFTTDNTLSSLVTSSTVGNSSSSSSSTPSSGTPSSGTPSPSHTPNVAPSMHAVSMGGLTALLITGAMEQAVTRELRNGPTSVVVTTAIAAGQIPTATITEEPAHLWSGSTPLTSERIQVQKSVAMITTPPSVDLTSADGGGDDDDDDDDSSASPRTITSLNITTVQSTVTLTSLFSSPNPMTSSAGPHFELFSAWACPGL